MNPELQETKPSDAERDGPSWETLYATAEAQQGCFSTEQAAQAGFSSQLLSKHLKNRNIERLHRGIYRLCRFPAADRGQEDLVVAWLWSGRVGTLSHETALVLHGLSDALPSVIHLTVPSKWSKRRLQPPAGVRLYYDNLTATDTDWVGAVPVTIPARAIVEVARAHGDVNVIDAACRQALREGKASLADLGEAVAYIGTSGGPPGAQIARPEITSGLTGTWLTQAVSGTCRTTPKPDWRLVAEEIAATHGGRLFENKFYPHTRTMFLALVWPIDAHDKMPDWKVLRDDAARRFEWVE